MALNNFANLKAAVRSWSKRDELQDSQIEDFITLAEQKFYFPDDPSVKPLRVREMEVRQTASTSTADRFLELPDRFLEMRKLQHNEDYNFMEILYRTPGQLIPVDSAGLPGLFTVTSQLEFERASDQAYTVEMQFWQRVQALSSSNTTNSILTNYPSLYLFGALAELFSEFRQSELEDRYRAKFYGAIAGANATNEMGRYGPAPIMLGDYSIP